MKNKINYYLMEYIIEQNSRHREIHRTQRGKGAGVLKSCDC